MCLILVHAEWEHTCFKGTFKDKTHLKIAVLAKSRCLTPVILPTWEAEMGRIKIPGEPGGNSSPNYISKKNNKSKMD
jgi:hypothetical protein